jgi:hypothetical protein
MKPAKRTAILTATSGAVAVALAGLGLAAAGTAAGSVTTSAVAARSTWTPPPDTIVAITGSAANGFEIRHYDGSELFLPTNSEAMAECGEYDTEVQRVRCRTEVRTWYRDLADTRRAMRYARWSTRQAMSREP